MINEAEVRFENEDLSGLVAVGSYLIDTLKRFGIRSVRDCDRASAEHYCGVVIVSGGDDLSALTRTETEHFAAKGRRSNERLACEASIIKPGEIVIMTNQKKEEPKAAGETKQPKDKFKEEFDALPLEKKIAYLMRMEAVTLSETFAYVVNSPMKVIEKVGDVMAEFGMKLEQEARKARRPNESHSETAERGEPGSKPKTRTAHRKASPPASKP